MTLVKYYTKKYCDENFYRAEEGFYYLSEEEAERNFTEPVYEYLHETNCGLVRNAKEFEHTDYNPEDFIEIYLTPENNPEYFI